MQDEEEKLFGPTGHHITTSEVSMVWHILRKPVPGEYRGKYPEACEGIGEMTPSEWRAAFPDGGVGGDMAEVSVEKGAILLQFIINALTEYITN